ncbi:MAG: ribonuclease E/G [Nitriliruptoraceae bacterium]
MEDAIAKGGTRMAAKRGARRSGGGNGGRRAHQRSGGVPEEVRRAILEGPPRTMLVTSRQDRTQIAVLEDRTVVEHYVTRKEDVTFVGNIYMARVQNVLPGMEAAFLDIGKGRNGVLYAGEVLYDELDLEEGESQRIENALKPGQKVLVQVTKDPMGSKGPRLTMRLSLAGRYMVLAPNSDLFGISRKLTDKERDRLRRIVKRIKPTEHGIIVRTAAEGASEEQITADVERLLAKWARVEQAAAEAKALTAVYEEPPLVVKVIRDNFGPEFERAIVDDEDLYRQVRGYLDQVAPELLDKVELYGAPTADARARAAGAPAIEPADEVAGRAEAAPSEEAPDQAASGEEAPEAAPSAAHSDGPAATTGPQDGADTDTASEPGQEPDPVVGADGRAAEDAEAERLVGPVDLAAAAARRAELPSLFEAYDVREQLRKAMGRKVWLPSGGYLIIESTEAMKVIDVNTGRFTGNKDTNLEEIVLRTNLEAADEIVRQLRLRDMGGIIVIDFIDMLLKANQEQVVRRLKRELLRDRTKTRVSEVSKLGLVQMTRKNVSQGLLESFSHSCEACEGRGLISELE